jgi:hypothetical protein
MSNEAFIFRPMRVDGPMCQHHRAKDLDLFAELVPNHSRFSGALYNFNNRRRNTIMPLM